MRIVTMVSVPEPLSTNFLRWIILLCVSSLVSACGDEPVEKSASSGCSADETEPVIVQYQAPEPTKSSKQMYMMPPQSFSSKPVQQGWGLQNQSVPDREPTGSVTQQTFKTPQNTGFQNQSDAAVSPWALPEQSASAVQQFQNTQRPWGPPATLKQRNQASDGQSRSSQQSNQYQWGRPVGGGYYGWGSGPYGAVPGAGYPVHAW